MENFLNQLISESWQKILDKEILLDTIKELDVIYKEKTVYPKKSKVFRMFKEMKHDDIKVVIIAQDPYPGVCNRSYSNQPMPSEPYAQGMAFSVLEHMKAPKSLQIILDSITEQFHSGIQMPPPSPNLTRWTKQGVFLLNMALTVEENKPNSHKEIWRSFIENVLITLSVYNPNIIYLLWGKEAQQLQKFIKNGFILKDIHPNAVNYNGNLKFNGCFNECNNLLKSMNLKPILW